MSVVGDQSRRAEGGAVRSDRDRGRLADIIFERRSAGPDHPRVREGKQLLLRPEASMLHPHGAVLMAKALLEQIKQVGADYLGGLEMGAIPITGAVCQHSHDSGAPIFGFFVRQQAKGHGAKKLIEGLAKGETLAGKKVAIVEDVTTTGESAFKAVEPCPEIGAEVVLIIAVVDREDGAHELFQSKGLPFKALYVASKFLSRDA